jgi:hypothetical protein
MKGTLPYCARPISDLVWEGGLHGTVFIDNGVPLTAGADVGWTPEVLVATAAGAALMATFLRMAQEAGIEIVGYVSAQRVSGGPVNGCPSLLVSPCISVRTDAAAQAVLPLIEQAIDCARGGDATSCNLTVEPRVTVVPASGPRW